MAWTAPMTAADNATFTAAQFNTHVRDNLNQTEVAKATTAGNYFVTTGANAIAERVISNQVVTTLEASSTTAAWVNLTTNGPAVTLTTGTKAIAWWGCHIGTETANNFAAASVAVSGATTVAADFNWCVSTDGLAASTAGTVDNGRRYSTCHIFTGLTAGSNTFTMQYRLQVTTNFSKRELIVMAL